MSQLLKKKCISVSNARFIQPSLKSIYSNFNWSTLLRSIDQNSSSKLCQFLKSISVPWKYSSSLKNISVNQTYFSSSKLLFIYLYPSTTWSHLFVHKLLRSKQLTCLQSHFKSDIPVGQNCSNNFSLSKTHAIFLQFHVFKIVW